MRVALIGGMDRLKRHYMNVAEEFGINLRVFTKSEVDIEAKIKNVDALIIFTNKVSHRAKMEVMNIARTRNIPVLMCHSCGVCTLRDCLNCIKRLKNKEKDKNKMVFSD